MKSTIEILDAVRQKRRLPSDYALQKVLGVSKQQISRYRTGKDSLGEDAAMKAADILGVDRGVMLAWIAGERAKIPTARDAWRVLAERLGGTAAAVAVAVFVILQPETQTALAALPFAAVDCGALCIMSNPHSVIFPLIISLLLFIPKKQQ